MACLSGLGTVHRAHILSALRQDTGRPLAIVCQDEETARRTIRELQSFSKEVPAFLPTRELTLYDASTVSRGWEQKRLRVLYGLGQGKIPVLVTSVEALMLRTVPRQTLFSATLLLQAGAEYALDELAARLTDAGYARTPMVEGVGQFSLRGGILDVFSPAQDAPIRCEFFGDTLDAMGYFDTVTQRRTEVLEQAVLLPASEVQPRLHPEGLPGLVADLQALIARQKRRKKPHAPLIATLERDLERLENGVSFPAADRYCGLIYPEFACAADYLSKDACVVFCDHGAVAHAAGAVQENMGHTLDAMLESGLVCGELCEFYQDWDALCRNLAGRSVLYLDNFLSAKFPDALPPKQLLSVAAKHLPSYGGSLDTVCEDLTAYQKQQFRSWVFCGNRRRGEILQQVLHEHGLTAVLDFPATRLPDKGEILLTEGALPAGMEYPALELAILTEGQLTAQSGRKRPSARTAAPTARSSIPLPTSLPAIWWCMNTTASAVIWAWSP